MDAYALESSPLAKYVLRIVDEDAWRGQPSELLAHIQTLASDGEMRMKAWPKDAKSLSGLLKRLAPNLRAIGIEVEFGSQGRGNKKRRCIEIRRMAEASGPSVPDKEITLLFDHSGGACEAKGDTAGTLPIGESAQNGLRMGTHGDGGDANPALGSEEDWEVVQI